MFKKFPARNFLFSAAIDILLEQLKNIKSMLLKSFWILIKIY